MSKHGLKALAFLALLPLLFSAPEGPRKPAARRAIGDERVDYREMTRILFKYRPGIDYNGLHARYREANPPSPCVCFHQYLLPPTAKSSVSPERIPGSLSGILVIANAALYANPTAQKAIDRYVRDVNAGYGCGVELLTVEGGSPEDLKSLIKARYDIGGLDGVVLIGRLPAAWFEIANDHPQYEGGYGYANWTCDLFFMDLDGLWTDTDRNGIYDSHANGTGDRSAEIFVGRIDTSTMGTYGSEVDLLRRYFDKDHAYWTGAIPLYHYGLAYIDHDWVEEGAGYFDGLYGPSSYQGLLWPGPSGTAVGKFDYINNRLSMPYYGFTQVWAHAEYDAHSFHTGGLCYEQEVHSRNPRSIGYNIDGCHACDWAAGGGRYFLCGGYIYNDSPTSLSVIGTTKSGGMLAFASFYRELGRNASLGEAFRSWLNLRIDSPESSPIIISWHYGMMIIGDPLVAFREVPGRDAPVTTTEPPLSFSVERRENRSFSQRKDVNTLTWQENPENSAAECLGYRIYEVTPTGLVPLADVSLGQSRYVDEKSAENAFLYAIATLDQSGAESDLAFAGVR